MKRKICELFKLVFYVLVISLFLLSCKKSDTQEKKFPSTSEEIEESIKNTQRIAKESSTIVDSAISKAYIQNGLVDPLEIAKSVELIDGVLSATPTVSGTGIIVEQKDGTYSNILIVSEDDNRLFKEGITKSSTVISKSANNLDGGFLYPNGSGKALILAPFQKSFNTNLNKISELLKSAGYSVDQFLDSEATLERFRGSFLDNYDVVFIRTHGIANQATKGGTISTLLLTGEEFKYTNKLQTLPLDEQKAVASAKPLGSDVAYWAISVPYLNLTTDGRFKNSWIYAGGCETSLVDKGPSSLSEAFLKLGAGGYNGFDADIATSIANPIAVNMTTEFSSGLSFDKASDAVRSDPWLLTKAWSLRILYAIAPDVVQTINVSLFDNNQESTKPFYLKDPRGTVVDAEGNAYKTISIGTQVWMAENLKTIKYSNGDLIGTTTPTTLNIESESIPEYQWAYDGNESNVVTYGRLYTWYAVTDNRNVCPTGWHVPSDDEWKELEIFLGMSINDANLADWRGTQGTMMQIGGSTGFDVLFAGERNPDGSFLTLNKSASFWTSTGKILDNSENRWIRWFVSNGIEIGRDWRAPSVGLSVRCLKNKN